MFKRNLILASIISLIIGMQFSLAANQYSVKINDANLVSKYEFTADGKTPLENTILVKNMSTDKDITLRLSGLDALTNNLGEIYFKNSGDPQSKLGVWIKMSQNDVNLKPLEEKTIKFNVELPSKITPGVYIGGISVEDITSDSSDAASDQNFSAKVKLRIVKRVYLSVPGEKISKYDFNSFAFNNKNNKANFTFNLVNQGNTLLSAKGAITITDTSSNQSTTIPINASGILQDSTFTAEYNWNNHPVWGNYKAVLNMDILEFDPFTETFTKIESVAKETNISLSDYASLIPYAIALVILILIILGFIIEHYIYLSKCTPYVVGEGETIKVIADKFKMSWQKLAKVNKIKAPYEVHSGDKILVMDKHK